MKEDPEIKCGWRWFTLFRRPKDDPYIDACEWHDKATTKGSWQEQHMSLSEVQNTFEQQLDSIDKRTGRNPNNWLHRFYVWATRRFTKFFWEGK